MSLNNDLMIPVMFKMPFQHTTQNYLNYTWVVTGYLYCTNS